MVQLTYQNNYTSQVECQITSSIAVRSKVQCASQCAHNEQCSYFQQSTNVDGDNICILCTKCAHIPGVGSAMVTWPKHTSDISEGELLTRL